MIFSNYAPDGIAIEQPPASLSLDAQNYLQRMFVQVSGQFANLEKQIADLKARVETLESNP